MTTKPDCAVVKIPKGNGKFRVIYNPNFALREVLAGHSQIIRDAMLSRCSFRVCHGFMPGRSPATNASYHVGYQYTLSMDLKDFFDTVTESHLTSTLPTNVVSDCLWAGAARQGLPTSPMLANIAAAPMDDKIIQYLEYRKIPAVYTRYADDLTVSSDDRELVLSLRGTIQTIAADHGFVVNNKKTEFQSASNGRRHVTGLVVDDKVHVPRRLRRKARAASHQGHYGSAAGLTSWAGSPKWICPICWSDSAHRTTRTSLSHFLYRRMPEHWLQQAPTRMSVYYAAASYIEGLAVIRGGITDYAPAYEEMRMQYTAQVLAGDI